MKSWKRGWRRLGNRREVVGGSRVRKRLTCVIHGNVQGIGFRWSVRELAARLGVTGYARNLGNGRMEVVAEGPETALETLRAFCYRGPDGATVTGVEATEGSATGEFPHFEIR